MHQHPIVFAGQPPGSLPLSSQAPSSPPHGQFSPPHPSYPSTHPSFNSSTAIPQVPTGSMDMSPFHPPPVSTVAPTPTSGGGGGGGHFQNPSISAGPALIAPNASPSCVPPPMMPPKTPNSPEAVQALLEENKDLLTAALEYQNIGRVVESAHYQARLHANLLVLATLADRMVSSQRLAFPNQNAPQPHAYYMRTLPVEDRENLRPASNSSSQPVLRAKLPASHAGSSPASHGSDYRLSYGAESRRRTKAKLSGPTTAGAKESLSKPTSPLDHPEPAHSLSPTMSSMALPSSTDSTEGPHITDDASMVAGSLTPPPPPLSLPLLEPFSEPRESFDMPRI